jgi:hypothetical protein
MMLLANSPGIRELPAEGQRRWKFWSWRPACR